MFKKYLLSIIIISHCIVYTNAQSDTIVFEQISKYEYPVFNSAFTAIFDKNDLPYVYTASSEYGVNIFDVSDLQNPQLIDQFLPGEFNDLKPMYVEQNGNHIFVAIGSFLGLNPQDAGLAIIDVTDPTNAFISDVWDSTYFDKGAHVVNVNEDFAYLGVMDSGLVVLDVSDKSNIQFASQLVPDPDYPAPPGAASQAQTRGMDFRNDTLWICVDRQGFRAIDVSDNYNPQEIGLYYFQDIYNDIKPANNEVVVVDNYAYISLDHCGMEVVDISDVNNMIHVTHFNPWDCVDTDWNGAGGHTNQLALSGDSLLFVSGADTEVLAFDIRDRENPILIGQYGTPGDLSATWGLSIKDNYLVLANVNASFPYNSDWGGIQIISWEMESTTSLSENDLNDQVSLLLFPNPTDNIVNIEFPQIDNYTVEITDPLGKVITSFNSIGEKKTYYNATGLSSGFYNVTVSNDNLGFIETVKFVVK